MPEPPKAELKSKLLKLHEIHDNIKTGYIEYGMYFWVISLSVIIGGFFHLAGVAAFILTLIFFYIAGRGYNKLKAASKR
jgi:hypothetical protein